jgi:hypothetical protein
VLRLQVLRLRPYLQVLRLQEPYLKERLSCLQERLSCLWQRLSCL